MAGLLSRGNTAALEAYSTLMKPVKVVCGVIHEANRLRPDGVIPGDCPRLTEVTGGEPFTVSLLWSSLDVNIMLYVWLCAPERYRPARAQVC